MFLFKHDDIKSLHCKYGKRTMSTPLTWPGLKIDMASLGLGLKFGLAQNFG